MDAYKRFIKSKNVDHDTIRMAHDNPNLLFVKRAMTGPKGNTMKKALDMYKGAAMKESFVIPEEIPANERTAFHGAAAAAAKSGKKSFNFGGKTHPVTMKKDTALKIADQKESMDDNDDDDERLVTMKKNTKKKSGETATMNPKLGNGKGKGAEMEQKESLTIRDKLMMVLEGDRSKHYKGATEAEPMDNNLKGAGAKKMKADIQGNAADPDLEKKSHDDAAKAGRAGPSGKARPNDKKDGDKKIINQPEDPTKKGQGSAEVKETRDQLSGIKAAYASIYEKKIDENYGITQDAKAHAKKNGENYDGDVSVQHRYDAYHYKKNGYTHFEPGSYGTRRYTKGSTGRGSKKIEPSHHSGVN